MATRSKLFRFQDRQPYKTSEVLALFLVGVSLSAIFILIYAAIGYLLDTILGKNA